MGFEILPIEDGDIDETDPKFDRFPEMDPTAQVESEATSEDPVVEHVDDFWKA